jgi:hypothetical protein
MSNAFVRLEALAHYQDEFDELLANMLKGLDHIGGITDNCAPEDLMVTQVASAF